MNGIQKFNTVDEYNKAMGVETRHPLVTVIDFSKANHVGEYPEGHSFGYYTVFLKEQMCGDMKYSRNYYDYQEGTLVFLAPEQTVRIDNHSQRLIVSNIELFLNYCTRFYERQFITRKHVNSDVLSRFENLLNDYFKSGLPQKHGLPSVKYCADNLNLSANYLGDLIKKETGKSAQEHVQLRLIEIAKEKMDDAE